MLMDGSKVDVSTGCDISFGSVYGVDATGGKGSVSTGFFENSNHNSNPISE